MPKPRCAHECCPARMFAFAFNNPKFSDRTLRLLVPSSCFWPASEQQGAGKAGTTAPPRKPGPDSGKLCTTQQPQTAEILHVNTIVLAKYSMFFWKMFDGDTFKESSEKVIDIRLELHEREAFKDLLRYMYTAQLEAATPEELLLVWQLSDRFIVDSCLEFCTSRLQALPFTFNSSCFVLEAKALPMTTTEIRHKLVTKSLTFLINHFEDSTKNKSNFQQLSSQVLELLLVSEDLSMSCEEEVYRALQGWIEANCKGTQVVNAAWEKFGPLVRWPLMRISFLKSHLSSMRDCCVALRDLLVEALLHHVSTDEEKETLAKENSTCHRFRRRANSPIPIKFVCVKPPVNQGITFFNISMEDWAHVDRLTTSKFTEEFLLCGCSFNWIAQVSGISRKPSLSLRMRKQRNHSSSTVSLVVSLWIWDANSSAYGLRWNYTSEKEREMEHMAIYTFGNGLDKCLNDSTFISNGATWCKAEVQVASDG